MIDDKNINFQKLALEGQHLKLDLGCGDRKRSGTIGLDISANSAADVVCDLSKEKIPFPDNTFSEIFCDDVLEHMIDLKPVLFELWRVSIPGGKIFISSPHFSSYNAYQDPTHFRSFAFRTFDYFDPGSTAVRHKYFQDLFSFSVKNRRICFREFLTPSGFPPFNPFRWLGIEALVNAFPKIYERFFCWMFPAVEMYYEIEVIK